MNTHWTRKAALVIVTTAFFATSITSASAATTALPWGWSYRNVSVGTSLTVAASRFHTRAVEGLCTRSFTVKVGNVTSVLVGNDEANNKYANRVGFVQFVSPRVAGPYGIHLGEGATRVKAALRGHPHTAIAPANGFQGGFIARGPGAEWLAITISKSSVTRLVIDDSRARVVSDVEQSGRC